MTIGVVIVTASDASGLGIIRALAISPIGLFLGGWIAERIYGEPVVESTT